MNTADAAYSTVHDYPGGSESLGPRIGMSPAVLRGKVNPNNDRNVLSLDEASRIMGVTGDHRMLQALAAEHGYTLAKVDSAPDAGSLIQSLLHANATEGEFDRALQEALSDNLITPNEMKTIERAGSAQAAALIVLLSKVRSLQGRAIA